MFHALFGVLALALTLALANGLLQLTELPVDFNSPAILVLLATALCNLCMSVSASSWRTPRALQALASLLALASGALAAASFYKTGLEAAGYSAHLTAILLLITGSVLHFILNLSSAPVASVSLDDSGRETGTVKWFNVTKGFGFITP